MNFIINVLIQINGITETEVGENIYIRKEYVINQKELILQI